MEELEPYVIQSIRDELSRAAIRDALLRYCRGVDRANEELFLSAFHPGAREDHGKYHGPVEEFAALTVARVRSGIIGIQHTLGNMLIELNGDLAQVETYFTAVYRDKAIPEMLVSVGGRYLDRFERRSDFWRIARRSAVSDWSSRQSIPPDEKGMLGYVCGVPGEADPVFQSRTWSPADETSMDVG